MTSFAFVLLSGALTFGVPMLLGARELYTLGRTGRGGGGDGPPPREPTITPAPRPLPTCLLPPPMPTRGPARVHVLEDA